MDTYDVRAESAGNGLRRGSISSIAGIDNALSSGLYILLALAQAGVVVEVATEQVRWVLDTVLGAS